MSQVVGAFAFASTGGVQDQRFNQGCCPQQQNPLASLLRKILQHLQGNGMCGPQGGHHHHHGPQGGHGHCGFHQGNPHFGQGAVAGHGHNGPFAAAGGNGGLNHALTAQDPFGGGIAAAGHAGHDGISHALSIKDPFGGGISVADSLGKGGASHAVSLKLPFGGPSLNLGASIGGLLG